VHHGDRLCDTSLADEGHADHWADQIQHLDVLAPWLDADVFAVLQLLELIKAELWAVVQEFIPELADIHAQEKVRVLLPAILGIKELQQVWIIVVPVEYLLFEVMVALLLYRSWILTDLLCLACRIGCCILPGMRLWSLVWEIA